MKYFDLHCDTATECFNKRTGLYKNNLHLNLEKGKIINSWVQIYAIWMDDMLRGERAYKHFCKVYDYFMLQLQTNTAVIDFCTSFEQIESTLLEKRKVALLAIEGSAALGGRLERVQEMYNRGVRLMTLTWNGHSEVGDGCMVEAAGGLTNFGEAVVKEMSELGMLVDVSHLAEKGFWDVVKYTDKPFIATHSNSKAICNHPRNLTDEQFEVFVQRKGLVGMNFYPVFINGTVAASIEQLLLHIDHFLEQGGEDVIAMGSDFDGAQMPKHIEGLQDIPYLYRLLIERYGKEKAEKFYFENAYDFFSRNL